MGRTGHQPIPRLLVVVLLALSSIGLFAGPASAFGTKCNDLSNHSGQVCVEIPDGTMVRGIVNVNGTIDGLTLTVQQCDGTGNNCQTISATHSLTTSWKPTAKGHVYRACAWYVDGHKCSPFIAVPT
jgi:hypothetical protein